MTNVGTILTHRNRPYVLIPVALLNLIPPFLAGLSNPDSLFDLGLFTLVMSASIFAYIFYLSKYETTAIKVLVFIDAALVTAWFSIVFLDEFSNAYLASIILVQLIFLLLGARYGLAMLGFASLANVLYLVINPHANILDNIFSISVQATVGLLAWVFVAAANEARKTAEESASRAREAMNEAHRLADEVTKLNHLLMNSQDHERRRLARDIHDGPLQSLGVQLLAAERAARRLQAGAYDQAASELDYLQHLTREAVDDLRGTVNALRNTLLDSGIEPALRNLARKTHDATGLQVNLNIRLEQDEKLPNPLVSGIYQLAVEALNNTKRHAGATTASIDLEGTDGQITLRISDDGRGFDYHAAKSQALSQGQIGLHSMKERAGELNGTISVTSAPGNGTTLTFVFTEPYRPITGTYLTGPLS